jgi:hypothetical protein
MKLTFTTQAQAQAVADRIHQFLIVKDPEYAASVQTGQTTAWDVPSNPKTRGANGPVADVTKWDVTTGPLRDGWVYDLATDSFSQP